MSSTFNDHHHPKKRERNENNIGILYPPSPSSSPSPTLKVNKYSHAIKQPPLTSSSAGKPRHPVIIYTHTPEIIHTNPKDFMALVQKLTGISRSDEDSSANRIVSDLIVDTGTGAGNGKGGFCNKAMISEESESSSVITTDENIGEHGQVSSSLPFSAGAIPPPPHPPLPPANPADNYICGNQPFASFDDQLFFAPNMRSSFSSSSSSSFGFDGLTEFCDF